YQRWQVELERQPVEFLGRRSADLIAWARGRLGQYIGADPADLVYVTNATTGLNVVARSLPLEPDDEVVSTDHEYGAIERTWRFVCEARHARYVKAAVPVPLASAEAIVEAVWARVSPRTRILHLSHLTSPTALIFPVAELCRRARNAGILTVVDGAHAPGQIPVNLDQVGADFYSANCHKWMCAPKGAAFLYARREVQPLLSPRVVSWGWQPDVPGPSPFIDEQQRQGTRDIAAWLAVPAAIDFMHEYHWPEHQGACHALATAARRAITAVTRLPALSPESPEWFGQMVSVPVPWSDAAVAQRRLREEFGIEIPVFSWNGLALLRISVQAYNSAADVDRLVDAVRRMIPPAAAPSSS
ncbi:MAG: aminotransferase class V-fold PLP-dependent enzyme, partial [Gemmatimonadales bacterium]